MPSSANKTSHAHSTLIDRLRSQSPMMIAMIGADVETAVIVRQSDAVWAEFDSTSATGYGRLAAHEFGPCPTCHVHVCRTHHTCHKSTS